MVGNQINSQQIVPSLKPTQLHTRSTVQNKGGYTHIRLNDTRDSIATHLNYNCDDVEIETVLQALLGETFSNKSTTEGDARLHIKAYEPWETRYTKTFFHALVFNHVAESCPKNTDEAYR